MPETSVTRKRSEEIQDIIERMPTTFGVIVSIIIIFIFALLLIFGYTIRYPDVVKGSLTVNSPVSPIKLVANGNGKLKLLGIKSMQRVKEGQILAYIENSANPQSIHRIDSILRAFDVKTDNYIKLYNSLPKNYSMGELNSKYYVFVNNLQNYIHNSSSKPIYKKSVGLNLILSQQKKALVTANEKLQMASLSLSFALKSYNRDSVLFLKRVISESELDRSKMNYLSNKDGYQNSLANLISSRQAIEQTKSEVESLGIAEPEKESELKIALISAFNDLEDNIKIWEQKYIFKAPFNGNVQFLKFWTNNQFIVAGEEVFTIIPEKGDLIGQLMLPVTGAGKVRVGQEVIIKLDDYPYVEYGSIKGYISSISLTTYTSKSAEGNADNYLITVDLPNGLKTNYGATLNFKFESRGIAEVITNDRKLIERLFENLKYRTN